MTPEASSNRSKELETKEKEGNIYIYNISGDMGETARMNAILDKSGDVTIWARDEENEIDFDDLRLTFASSGSRYGQLAKRILRRMFVGLSQQKRSVEIEYPDLTESYINMEGIWIDKENGLYVRGVKGDDGGSGLIDLIVQEDGDVAINFRSLNPEIAEKIGFGISIEFCTPAGGGGRQPILHDGFRRFARELAKHVQ